MPAEILALSRMKRERLSRLRRYGAAAGLEVVLLAEVETETVAPLRVSVIVLGADGAEALAVFPNSDEGRDAAESLAGAVLRALELLQSPPPFGVA
nr:hypothetical protein [Methylobacterium sp. L1A1]